MHEDTRICLWVYNKDDRYTPGCVKNHGMRVNSSVKVTTYRYCPYCGRTLRVARQDNT